MRITLDAAANAAAAAADVPVFSISVFQLDEYIYRMPKWIIYYFQNDDDDDDDDEM